MKRILFIVGKSGAGKDTVARILKDVFGYPLVCSYTTRAKRAWETDGVQHHFVQLDRERIEFMKWHGDLFAHTVFGGHDYWTTKEQLAELAKQTGPADLRPIVYIVDEAGLRPLLDDKMLRMEWRFYLCKVTRPYQTREKEVGVDRVKRDPIASLVDDSEYHFHIDNSRDMDYLHRQVSFMAQSILYNP